MTMRVPTAISMWATTFIGRQNLSPIHFTFQTRSAKLTSVAPLIANRVVFLVPYSMGSIRRMWELNWLDVLTDCIERPIQWIRFETDAVLDNVVELPSLIHHDWNHRLVCSGPLWRNHMALSKTNFFNAQSLSHHWAIEQLFYMSRRERLLEHR